MIHSREVANSVFPETPIAPVHVPVAVVHMVRHDPLAAIQQLLSISIHEVVNETRYKRIVADLYRITRRIENELWLRRRALEQEQEAWIAAHL